MAIFRLGDTTWEHLEFPEEVWGKRPECVEEFISNMVPEVTKVTSRSENRDFRWFYGKVVVSKEGTAKVTWPELRDAQEGIPNYCLSYYPFLRLEASGFGNFLGWFDYVSGEKLEESPVLIISDKDYPNTTTFLAYFE